MIQL